MQTTQLIHSVIVLLVFCFLSCLSFPVNAVSGSAVEEIMTDINRQYQRLGLPNDGRITFEEMALLDSRPYQIRKYNVVKKIRRSSDNSELIFILAGQSNMTGYGTTAQLPLAYQRTPPNVQFYLNDYPAEMSTFPRFGPEVGFAHTLARRFPHKSIKLIKFAVGGTSLYAWAPQWRADKARLTHNANVGSLFKKLLQTIKIHTNKRGSQLAGILWMQGETDARYPSTANNYSRHLSQFVTALRQELKAPHLAFFMGAINPPPQFFPYLQVVRKAQRELITSIDNSQLVSTKGLAKGNDHLHYNTDGQLVLGIRFARAYIAAMR